MLDAQLARIERLDPQVNAVCTLSVDAARERAAAADEATADGESWGPLHGVSVTIKDAIATAGIRSTGGSPALLEHVPQDDAPVVAAIKDAGAIVFGKTNVPLWSGDFQTFNEMFGTTNNPWDLTPRAGRVVGRRGCGGRLWHDELRDRHRHRWIGACAVGVLRSVRPQAVVRGRSRRSAISTSRNGGVTESDVNVFGPIARSADDLAMLFDLLAGPTPDRAVGWRLDLPRADVTDLRSLRVATWFDEPSRADGCRDDSDPGWRRRSPGRCRGVRRSQRPSAVRLQPRRGTPVDG